MIFETMKGNYKRASEHRKQKYSETFRSSHFLFDDCTLYKSGKFGLCVIQQRFNEKLKITWWGPIDPWLANDIYEAEGFNDFFLKHAREVEGGCYPTIEVRKLMYALDMKPMKKGLWETPLASKNIAFML